MSGGNGFVGARARVRLAPRAARQGSVAPATRTVKHAVRDQAARVQQLVVRGVRDEWRAARDVRVRRRRVKCARQLQVTLARHVAPVVLIKIVELVIDKDGRRHRRRHGEREQARRRRARPARAHGARARRRSRTRAVVLQRDLDDAVRRRLDREAERDEGDREQHEEDDDGARRDDRLPRLGGAAGVCACAGACERAPRTGGAGQAGAAHAPSSAAAQSRRRGGAATASSPTRTTRARAPERRPRSGAP